MKTVVFTIASKNYFAYVRTIMQSLEKSNPQMDRFVVVVDELDDEFMALPRNFELLELNRLDLPHPEQMKFRYDVMELNTAVKPFAILKLFESYERVIYLDPDIYVYKKLIPVEEALDEGANFVLTPHFNALFRDDGMHPDEPDIMRAGIYNLGFIALNRCADTIEMVSWWANKLEKLCVNEQSKGIFVDQKWIDLVPGYYSNVCILRNSGLNVAYWNLSHRKIYKDEKNQVWVSNGKKEENLIFFHFSGLDPNNIEAISKYQNRYRLKDLGDGAELFEDYAKKVLSNEFDMWHKFKYSYATYKDGRPVLKEHRMKYRQNKRLQGYCGENPFEFPEIFYGEKKIDLAGDGVNLIGYISSEHGLGEACRLTARCLEAANISWTAYDYEIGNSSKKGDVTYQKKVQQFIKYNKSIININADQMAGLYQHMPEELRDTYTIGVWYWELPTFPLKWYNAFQYVNEIWAPTQFVADCLKKIATCPVYHMPPGIHRDLPDTKMYNRKYFKLPENTFLFLNMFDVYSFSGRKNPEATVKAFKNAFASDDMKVGLVLKLNNSGYTDKVRRSLAKLTSDYKNIYILAETLSREAVNGLIMCCDAAVSLHRSEGLGLLCEEAMAYGKPVIATGWSGNMDFMNVTNSCLVKYEMTKVGEDIGPYEAWQEWAEPSVEDAAMYMERLVNEEVYYERISHAAQKTIQEEFSPKVCGERMKRRLKEIDKDCGKNKNKTLKMNKIIVLSLISCYQRLAAKKLSEDEMKGLMEKWEKKEIVDIEKVAQDFMKLDWMNDESCEEFIIHTYKVFFDRTPLEEEIKPWETFIQSNKNEKVGKILFLEEVIKSDEFLKEYAPVYRNQINSSTSLLTKYKWNIKRLIKCILRKE